MDDAAAVDVAAEEDEDTARLQLAHDLDRDLVALGAADDGTEPGHAAVDQLDAPGTQLDVIDGTVELHLVAVRDDGAGGEAFLVGVLRTELDDLRLASAREAHALDDLFGEQRGDTRVERLAQIGQPHLLAGHRMQQRLGALQDGRQVTQFLDLLAGESVDHRQEVGGVGEGDRGVGSEFGDRRLDLLLSLFDDGRGAADGAGGDVTRHQASSPTCECPWS